MSTPRISIIAIDNHPDPAAVAEYLQDIGAIPAYYGETAFACPYSPGEEIAYFKKTSVMHAVGFIPTWSLYVREHDTLVVVADCESPADEARVARDYRELYAAKSGVSPDSIPVTFTRDNEPYAEYASRWLDAGGMAAYHARKAVHANLPDATGVEADLSRIADQGAIWVNFEYRNTAFSLRILSLRISDRNRVVLFRSPAVDGYGLTLDPDCSDLQNKADCLLDQEGITSDKMDTPPDSVRFDRLEQGMAEIKETLKEIGITSDNMDSPPASVRFDRLEHGIAEIKETLKELIKK